MYAKLTIPERLKDLRVVDKHLTLEQLAEQTGLSKSALGKYETDDYKDISPFAIATLADFYGVSTDYLMGLTENKNHPNTELQSLHLSDDMVELLSSGKINNRLLCELAAHPNFRRLMIDMEICIDQIANMRVEQMNLVLEATRQTVMSKYAPGEDDLYMRTLELGQVQESDFYSHVMHDVPDDAVQVIVHNMAVKIAFLYLSQFQRPHIEIIFSRRIFAEDTLPGGFHHQIHLFHPHIGDLVNADFHIYHQTPEVRVGSQFAEKPVVDFAAA